MALFLDQLKVATTPVIRLEEDVRSEVAASGDVIERSGQHKPSFAHLIDSAGSLVPLLR